MVTATQKHGVPGPNTEGSAPRAGLLEGRCCSSLRALLPACTPGLPASEAAPASPSCGYALHHTSGDSQLLITQQLSKCGAAHSITAACGTPHQCCCNSSNAFVQPLAHCFVSLRTC